MPLIIPNQLPAAETLQSENIFTMEIGRASTQEIRPLKIVIVNLMPTKIATETQLARVLSNTPLQVEMTLVTMGSHESTHISQEHMNSFYKTIDEIKDQYFDGMMLTGAPVEKLPYEQVDYWKELSEIFEFAKTNVYTSCRPSRRSDARTWATRKSERSRATSRRSRPARSWKSRRGSHPGLPTPRRRYGRRSMDRIARASTGERRLVFEAAAQRMALAPAVVEKDFWVCYTLDHLFHRSGFAESMVFKGGTSLSKAFGLIERFSEDIDLILDWRLLGYGEDEPWEPRSNSAQERFKADSIGRTNAFLADAFAPKLRATLSESLGTEASVRCGAEEETVYFDYPRSYESAGTLDTIKLEIGPMAAWSPSEEAVITPYAADVVPFGPELSTTVRTASPERTFWEKATILHQEANRPEGKAMPRRYSRHYYDMYRLGHSFVLGRAVAQPGLLEQVVRFKEKFYRTPWAKLADARPGTLRLAPPKGRLDELAADYASMRPMLFGSYPSIDEIVAYMVELEETINGLS